MNVFQAELLRARTRLIEERQWLQEEIAQAHELESLKVLHVRLREVEERLRNLNQETV